MFKFIFLITAGVLSGISYCSANDIYEKDTGSLTGKIDLPSPKYANRVVVYLQHDFEKRFPPPKEYAVMDQKGMEFHPFVLPILLGTTVNFPNNDPFFHNVFSAPGSIDEFNLGLYPTGIEKTITFNKAGTVVLLCNIHQDMEAYIVILESPFFSLPDRDGNFEINNIPPGEYVVKVWSVKYKTNPEKIKIIPNEKVKKNFFLK